MFVGAAPDSPSIRGSSAAVDPTLRTSPLAVALALVIGVAITLCVYGYQFGQSNHTVYLLSALHASDPKILARDWFTTQTFQYHAAFGWLARALIATSSLESGFLAGYLLLVIAFHVAWLRLTLLLGGALKTYLASVLMYHLSAGGTGLGMYQFFQDSSFLPSNIASVLLLGAIVLWIDRRGIASGICIGLAGSFHLNYALVGAALWIVLIFWDALAAARRRTRSTSLGVRSILPWRDQRFWIATAAALLPSIANAGYALALRLRAPPPIPLQEFVDLYVRFRHPHHYDPRSWPAALWISFLWPILPAIAAYTILRRRAAQTIRTHLRDAARIFVYFAALLVITLLGAGFWFVSETLIQLSLYRFSIYVQLLACIGAALFVCDCTRRAHISLYIVAIAAALIAGLTPVLIWAGPRVGWISVQGITTFINHKRGGLVLFAVLSSAPALHELLAAMRHARPRATAQLAMMLTLAALITLGWSRLIGLTQVLAKPDDQYLALCAWVRERTPTEAVFLVPPSETEFRYYARRAIVVNFKGVPQLSGELRQWRDRLQDVLGIRDLLDLPRGFDKIAPAMTRIYADRSADELIAVAHEYRAGYIVTTRPYDDRGLRLIRNVGGEYLLYAVTR